MIKELDKMMTLIYKECKDQDGFLYCKYVDENFTGWFYKIRLIKVNY